MSPHFLFRVELDPDPHDPDAQHGINDYELASRLSYFLWSTMPDEVLFRLAAEGKLHHEKVLDQQVTRTLKGRERPMLANGDSREILEDLMQFRDPLYREVADLTVETDGRKVKAVASEILERL